MEATTGDADMTRRRKTKPTDLTLDKLTWLFAGLIILAAVAGVIGGGSTLGNATDQINATVPLPNRGNVVPDFSLHSDDNVGLRIASWFCLSVVMIGLGVGVIALL